MERDMSSSIADNITQEVRPTTLDWFISAKDPRELWADNWFAFVLELTSVCLFLRVCSHAKKTGPRAAFLVMSLIFAAFGLELFQHLPRPGYQLWWYHQGVLNFFEHRAPLYVICLFTVLYYCMDVMNRRMNLPVLTQSVVNAACACLLLFPGLWLAPNLLLVMVHFDEPIFRDRIFTVPYSQITVMFLLFFHSGYVYNSNFEAIDRQDRNFSSYLRNAVLSGSITAAYAIVEFYILHMVLRHIMQGPIAVCFLGAIFILGWLAKNEVLEEVNDHTWAGVDFVRRRKEWFFLGAFFATLVLIPILVRPENLKSNGERLEYGPCDVTQSVSNMSPLEIVRRRYVCPSGTNKFGFDFHCVPNSELTNEVKTSYTICGTPYENPVWLSTKLLLYSLFCIPVFYSVFSISVQRATKSQDSVPKLKKVA